MSTISQVAPAKTPKEIAAQELADSGSVKRASIAAKVTMGQVKRWQKEADFQELVIEYRSVPVILTITNLQKLGQKAVAVLEEGLGETGVSKNKLTAAKIVLAHLRDLTHQLDWAERLKQLEAIILANNIVLPTIDVELDALPSVNSSTIDALDSDEPDDSLDDDE